VRQIEDPKHYYLSEDGKKTNLLTALDNLSLHFPENLQELAFPDGFVFPPSFEYQMNVGQMTIGTKNNKVWQS